MIMIVLYHYQCWGGYVFNNKLLNIAVGRGFIGVDIFFFFSALGLCYSWEKNSLATFYKNRALRIIPCYILLACYRFSMLYMVGMQLSVSEMLLSFSTLSYHLGGFTLDWFLSALIAFYVFFPLLYAFVKKTQCFGLILFSLLIAAIAHVANFGWGYGAFVARVLVFLLGIFYYFNKDKVKPLAIALVFFIIAGILCPARLILFLKYTFLSPLMIVGIALFYLVVQKVKMVVVPIKFIGKHSLEVYLGNIIAFKAIAIPSPLLRLVGYVGLNTACAFVYWGWNKMANSLIKRIK